MNYLGEFDRPLAAGLDFSRSPDALLLWWLVLFIEALVLFPTIEREGRQQRPFRRGTSGTSDPDSSWSSATKGTGDDAVLGSMVTSALPLC